MNKRNSLLLSLICFCGCTSEDYINGIVTETRIVEHSQIGEHATYSGSEYVVDFGECKLTFHGNRKPGEEIRLLREQVNNHE